MTTLVIMTTMLLVTVTKLLIMIMTTMTTMIVMMMWPWSAEDSEELWQWRCCDACHTRWTRLYIYRDFEIMIYLQICDCKIRYIYINMNVVQTPGLLFSVGLAVRLLMLGRNLLLDKAQRLLLTSRHKMGMLYKQCLLFAKDVSSFALQFCNDYGHVILC